METVGSVMHSVCGPGNAHPQSSRHQVFHQVSLYLPKLLVLPPVHTWIWACLETKSLLVSGSAVFCHGDFNSPRALPVRSHSMAQGWKHPSSPAWHALASPPVPAFSHSVQESYCVKMPGLDSLAAVISHHLLNTSGLLPDQSAQAWQSDRITAIDIVYSRLPGRPFHFSLINNFPLLS